MSLNKTIRTWFADNPGKHFTECMLEGIGAVERDERTSAIRALHRLVLLGHIDAEGSKSARRYRKGRAARAFKKKGDRNAS